jgi:hypothetical protein
MNSSIGLKLSLISTAVAISCSSHAPAIPPEKESSKNIQMAVVSLREAQPDSPQDDYFSAKILPIVEKCQPCHFKGGKVYAQLPFDDPKTIHHLGVKLFSRIQDKNDQVTIRTFLGQAQSLKREMFQK